MKTCSIKGCDSKHRAKGLCNKHYLQSRPRPNRGVGNPNWNQGRTVPEGEPGLLTHTPAGTIILHGPPGTGYTWGCRCAACREANSKRGHRRRKERERGPIPENVPHGKPSTYNNWGCRCKECTLAWSKKCKADYWRRKGKK